MPRFSYCVLAILALAPCASAQSEVVGYTFQGPNNAASGASGGGYFTFDPTVLPIIAHSPNYPYNTATYSLHGDGAIDDNLTDKVDPGYIDGSYAEIDALSPTKPPSGGFLRYGPLGSFKNITIYTNEGGVLSSSLPLGSVLSSYGGVRDIGGGPINSLARYTQIDHPAVSEFTAQDVFSDKTSLTKHAIANGAVSVDFTPHINVGGQEFDVPIGTVAAMFGVDHFNWQQKITSPYYSVKSEGGGPSEVGQPYLDPNPYPGAQYFLTNSAGMKIPVDNSGGPSTYNPFYLNETPTGSFFDRSANTTYYYLHFEDQPKTPSSFNPLGLSRSFRTELVGVKADGTIVQTNIGFSWRSNAVYDDSGIVGGSASYDRTATGAGPSIIAGGISDFQFIVTPEPSAFVLAALGGLAMLWRRLRVRAGNSFGKPG